MTEDEARAAELVRAIEAEDGEAALLTREDRDQAEARARAEAAGHSGRRADDRFIAARAGFASARLATRHPGIAALIARSRWPGWVGVVLPLLALPRHSGSWHPMLVLLRLRLPRRSARSSRAQAAHCIGS